MRHWVAVWEGEPPESTDAARAMFVRLYERYLFRATEPPTPRMRAFVAALEARYGDVAELAPACGLWTTSPLIRQARGPLLYFELAPRRADETIPFLVGTVRRHGLTCYAPWPNLLVAVPPPPEAPPGSRAASPVELRVNGHIFVIPLDQVRRLERRLRRRYAALWWDLDLHLRGRIPGPVRATRESGLYEVLTEWINDPVAPPPARQLVDVWRALGELS